MLLLIKKVLQQAFAYGYTLFDTTECYTGINVDGTTAYNEEVVGYALRPVWDKVVIATKCGVQHGAGACGVWQYRDRNRCFTEYAA